MRKFLLCLAGLVSWSGVPLAHAGSGTPFAETGAALGMLAGMAFGLYYFIKLFTGSQQDDDQAIDKEDTPGTKRDAGQAASTSRKGMTSSRRQYRSRGKYSELIELLYSPALLIPLATGILIYIYYVNHI